MANVDELIHNINAFVLKETENDQSLEDLLPEFEGKEKIETFVEDFEAKIAKLLRRQRKRILEAVKTFVSKDDEELLDALLSYLKGQVFKDDAFAVELSEEATKFLDMSVQEFSKVIMDSIDQDIQFEVLSQRTITWIQEWSFQLGEIMKNTSHKAVEKVLVEGIKQGHGIDKIENALSELPEFNRSRARSTAITEVLTASSVAQQESYAQSPAVTHKKWLHSYAKYSKPRENHLELDGTIVGKFDDFVIPGSEERAQYPRDIRLSPKERINCHCALSPVVDEAIFALSVDEREKIRQQALDELNAA